MLAGTCTATGAGDAIEVVAGPAEMVLSAGLLVAVEASPEVAVWVTGCCDAGAEGGALVLVVVAAPSELVDDELESAEVELESVSRAAPVVGRGAEAAVVLVGAEASLVAAGVESVVLESVAGAAVDGADAASPAAGAFAWSEVAVVAGAEVDAAGVVAAGVEAAGVVAAGVEAAGVVAAGVEAAGAACDCGAESSRFDVAAGAGASAGTLGGPPLVGPAGEEPPPCVPPGPPPAPATSWAWAADEPTVIVGAGGGLLATVADTVGAGGAVGIGGGGGAMFVTTGAAASALARALTLLDDGELPELFGWCVGGSSE